MRRKEGRKERCDASFVLNTIPRFCYINYFPSSSLLCACRSGMFAVGPESAGAHPGPVCYRKGGYLAVTGASERICDDHCGFAYEFLTVQLSVNPVFSYSLPLSRPADANLALGRIVPRYFPSIFGPTEDQPLDEEGTRHVFAALAQEVNDYYSADAVSKGLASAPAPKSVDEIAAGFVAVANEAMCRPIRALTQMKGYDVSTHVLACFGGAGPQHGELLA